MFLHLSTTNLSILLVGLVLVALNALASSRLAPLLARLFARRTHSLRGHRPAHRGA